ncbi:unnamed protein product, partial [Allacma fusca]
HPSIEVLSGPARDMELLPIELLQDVIEQVAMTFEKKNKVLGI